MAHSPSIPAQQRPRRTARRQRAGRAESAEAGSAVRGTTRNLTQIAFDTQRGVAKADASRLFQRVAATSSLPLGKLRAELIPDSSWKKAGKTLGQQASQTTARLGHILSVAERIWGNEQDATEWLNSPHPELQGSTPLALIRTEAGGRAVEALLGALEFGFPL